MMDEVTDSNNSQCSVATTFIGFFAGLFATSLIVNFFMVTVLVTIVCKIRKLQQNTGEDYREREKNLYIAKVSNVMWSDAAPEYGQENERSTDLEDLSMSVTSQDKMKDFQIEENSFDNPHYEHVQSAKKTVRFTSV